MYQDGFILLNSGMAKGKFPSWKYYPTLSHKNLIFELSQIDPAWNCSLAYYILLIFMKICKWKHEPRAILKEIYMNRTLYFIMNIPKCCECC